MSRTIKAPDERRQELLGIGLNLFMRKGAEGVSIKEVVQQANVATGLFYYYFKSKDAFLEEAINAYIEGTIGNMLEGLQNGEIPLLQRVKSTLAAFQEHALRLAPLMREEAITSLQHHVLMDNMLQRLCPIIQEIIEQGNGEGVFRVENPAVAAPFIIHGLSGVLHENLSDELKDNFQKDIQTLLFTVLGVTHDRTPSEVNLDGNT